MATTVVLEEDLEIPLVRSLAEFRAWATSEDFPETGRIDYIAGRIEVDMSPEDLFTHGTLKVRLVSVLDRLVEESDLGHILSDRARVSSPEADLSAEPDIVFVSHQAIESGRVRLIPKAGQAERFIELEGAPELVVEIVSDHSVAKDTERLPQAYWRAGVAEYWLVDARGRQLSFQIFHRGPEGFQPAPADSEGFQYSRVLDTRFRVSRRARQAGRWSYQVETKPS